MQAIHGLAVGGFVTGASVLHEKTAHQMQCFGSMPEVKNLVDHLLQGEVDVHAFVKMSIQ